MMNCIVIMVLSFSDGYLIIRNVVFRMIKAHILLLIMVKVKYMWNLNQVSMITIHLIK